MTLQNCQHIVLDAGHISVRSDLADKAALGAVKARENQEYSDEDYQRLESLMYDKFYVKLESAQVRSSALRCGSERLLILGRTASHGTESPSLPRRSRRRRCGTRIGRRRAPHPRTDVSHVPRTELHPRAGAQSHALQGLWFAPAAPGQRAYFLLRSSERS